MLGTSLATASMQTASTTPPSLSRPSDSERRSSRLRGLHYLRNYTANHLHPSRSNEAAPQLSRTTSSPNTANSPANATITTTPTPAQNRSTARRPTPRRNQTTDDRSGSERDREQQVLPARIESGENGWIPTIQGRSGLSRESLHPTSTSTASASPEPSSTAANMTRNRSATAVATGPTPTAISPTSQRRPSALDSATADSTPQPSASTSAPANKDLPTIRFIPHIETRSNRPSLSFSAVSRTLKSTNSVVRVGRYSERDSATQQPNSNPVGFKSKVVSRRHCEFWCTDGQWYIKDVKSSSGTFLNHVRLSSPNQESRPFPVNDGDVVQLGIDFKGGEEIIFRCVKIRVECNRGWQKSLNSFNTTAHKRLLKNATNAKTRDSDAASVHSSECSICLNAVAPCQALFVAPCSHVWHYKCVRNLIQSPSWPNFMCPNCRFVADLEADVEPPSDDDLETDMLPEESGPMQEASGSSDDNVAQTLDEEALQPSRTVTHLSRLQQVDNDLAALLSQTALTSTSPLTGTTRQTRPETTSGTQPITITPSTPITRQPSDPCSVRSVTPTSHTQFALAAGTITEGPLTPRNDAGPFVLDGSGGSERADVNATAQEGSGSIVRRVLPPQ